MTIFDIFVSGTMGRNFPYRKGTTPKRPLRTIRRAMEEIERQEKGRDQAKGEIKVIPNETSQTN